MERNFPRVQLPGVDREQADALTAELEYRRTLRFNFSAAMVATGKHIYANTVTGAEKARRRKTGKAQRAARKVHRVR